MKNGCGLQVDYEILQKMLEAAGKTVYVEMAHSHVAPTFRQVDVVIFLELFDARWLPYGREFWLFPNSEWWRQEWDQYIPSVNRVLCKTHDCFELWKGRAPDRCTYIGFESNDLYAPAVPRKREFLHLAGGSINKGSSFVLQAWRDFNLPYPLTIIGQNIGAGAKWVRSTPNVKWIPRVLSIHQAMNEYQFHLLPSRYEGWGHALHEGLGVGAIMLTTDAQPMNEATGLPKELLIPYDNIDHKRVPDSLAGGDSFTNMYNVSPAAIAAKVKAAWEMTTVQVETASKEARAGFLKDRAAFRESFAEVIKSKRDIVLVTTYYRPEYLWACLQSIVDAEGGADKDVWVIHDKHVNDGNKSVEESQNLEVLKEFSGKFAGFQYIEMPATSYSGNSRCTLESYKRAYNTNGVRFVYLVEDDILVEKDFFKWHEAVQAKGDYLCSVGRLQTTREDLTQSDDPNAYVESRSDYTSWGSCWKRESLALLVEHCVGDYYGNMTAYIQRRFPNSQFGSVWTEQDGLIRRVLVESGKCTASPCMKRAYHVGITGYHRSQGYRFTGTLQQKVQQLNDALKNGTLPGLRKDYVDLNDIDVPRGSTPEWSELKAVQRLL